ncbi:MAG: DinB family protein [Panacibacter sp.]
MNPANQTEVFIKMVLSNWELQNERLNQMLASVSDEQLLKETAPGRNTGIYLLGHLTAVSDGILPLLGLGDKLYPQLQDIFLTSADKSGHEFPSVTELKNCWNQVNATLADKFASMQTNHWFGRHMSVSEEDFAKEPHRNKLNVIINRTNHQSYHLGQLIYLK